MERGYSILLLAIVASVVVGKPQTVDPSLATTQDGGAGPPTEEALTCECLQQIQSDVLPGVLSATKDLSNVVDELFTAANRAEISPVATRSFCFFCGRIRRTYGHVHGGWHRTYRPTYHHGNHHGHHHGHHGRRRRQVPQEAQLCPIEDVRATATNAKEGAKVVREVLAAVQADPREISQDLLDEVTQLYNEANESVKSLKSVTSSINTECTRNQNGGDVAFPGEQ